MAKSKVHIKRRLRVRKQRNKKLISVRKAMAKAARGETNGNHTNSDRI